MSPTFRSGGAAMEKLPDAPSAFDAAIEASLSSTIEERFERMEEQISLLREAIGDLAIAVRSRGDCPAGISDRSALSDFATEVVDALLQARVLEHALGPEPELKPRKGTVDTMLAPYRLDTEAVEKLLEDDEGMMSSKAFAELLSISIQSLHERRKKGLTIGLSQTKRNVWFPRAQFDDKRRSILSGISDVLSCFDGDGWAAHRYLSTSHAFLDGTTGYDALRRGRSKEVLTSIRSMREGAYE